MTSFMSNREYVLTQGAMCPSCKSSMIEQKDVVEDLYNKVQLCDMECLSCDLTWTEKYKHKADNLFVLYGYEVDSYPVRNSQ